MHEVDFGCVNIKHLNFFVSGLKFTTFFLPKREWLCLKLRFLIVDTLTSSGDIRNRSLKLSEIGPNFGSFWPHKFKGVGLQQFVAKFVFVPASWHIMWKSLVGLFALTPKLLASIRWILGQFYNFHCWKNCWDDPCPRCHAC